LSPAVGSGGNREVSTPMVEVSDSRDLANPGSRECTSVVDAALDRLNVALVHLDSGWNPRQP